MTLFAGKFRISTRYWLLLPVILSILSACSLLEDPEPLHTLPRHAAVASAHPQATRAGLDVLAKGGNAIDAAIAVAASLGVVEPYSAGLGGGGFWLIYLADRHEYRFLDARERAPAAADADYYLNADGEVNRDKAINGPTAAAIPGQPAAFDYLARTWGKLPLSTSLSAAIRQARDGFVVDGHYRQMLGFRQEAIRRYPASRRQFLDPNGQIPQPGFLLRQPDLANTLQAIADQGRDGFYRGPVAQALVDSVTRDGGHWSLKDLEQYRVVERAPVMVRLGEHTLVSAPPPSSGGIALGQMLQMLDELHWQEQDELMRTHLLTEVMRRAYFDRAHYLGDPDFVQVPTKKLLAPEHIRHWLQGINPQQATASVQLGEPATLEEGFHTTHLSVIDQHGNMVSATLSINLPFGSAFTADGTGVLLNNEMDDFSASPGVANAYGLVGNSANAIAPGKRPLSSMSPSFLVSDHDAAIIGTPGGSRIISMVLLGMLEHLQGKPVYEWVGRPRFHHQYLPDVLEFEPGAFTDDEQRALTAMGHTLKSAGRQYGNMQAILFNRVSGEVSAASDPRGIGLAAMLPVRTTTDDD